jgi:hypothetical protein
MVTGEFERQAGGDTIATVLGVLLLDETDAVPQRLALRAADEDPAATWLVDGTLCVDEDAAAGGAVDRRRKMVGDRDGRDWEIWHVRIPRPCMA